MSKRHFGLAVLLLVALTALPLSGRPQGQSYPMADHLASRVIAKYQDSSCQQLAAEKQQQPNPQQAAMKQRAVQALQKDPQLRAYFINKVAGPIANKMFECGMIP